jgi:putative Holliday junction resolvase
MTAEFPSRGRLAGIDYGTVRIGVAVTDPDRTLASPHDNYTRGDEAADARYFQELVLQEQIAAFVVGLPVHTSGRESEKSREARAFGEWLSGTTGLAVRYYDERFTSSQAAELLGGAGLSRIQRRKRLDKLAAQILLASYLEADQPRDNDPGSLGGP